MIARLRAFLRPQPALCSDCGVVIRERVRRPCPICRSTRRTLARGWAESVSNEDLVS